MILHCLPVYRLQGSIRLPASKSYTIRAFIIAAQGGRSCIRHASDCQDAQVALSIAKALGTRVVKDKDAWRCEASCVKIKSTTFNVGESGTSLRFLLPLLALRANKAKVEGQGTLIGRPNAHLCSALRAQGMDIRGVGAKESVPIVFNGGMLAGGEIHIDGSLSSQFISALLIALPVLSVDSRLRLTGKELVSQDYIQMTQSILAKAGIAIQPIAQREYVIKGGQSFKGLKNFYVPSDDGLAAFAMGACALVNSNVLLKGHWDADLMQSDSHIFEFLERMGVVLKRTKNSIAIQGPFALKGGVFSLKNCPDLVPIMSVLALFAQGTTRLIDIHHARAKESDRISDLRNELLKIGARVRETKDALIIEPQATYISGQQLDAHQDHRLAMAFSVLGCRVACRVQGIESVHKSYPVFVDDMKILGFNCNA